MSTLISKYKIPCSLALIAASVLLPSISHADVRYTMEMKMGGASAGQDADAGAPAMGGSIRTTTYLKDMREREETAMNFGPMKMTTTTITQCDKHQEIKVDPDLKIYTVSPIGALAFGGQMPPSRPGMGRHNASGGDGTGPGKETVTFTAKDMGTEKVADINAHHSMITFRTQASGCAGNSDTTMKMELWTAPIKASLNCPERYAASRVIPSANGCQITYEMKGDLSGLRDVFGQMAVKQVFYDDKDKPLFTRDLREHSTAPLDDALFDVPSDYKKVTDDEFAKQQQKKIMNSFTHGGGMPGGAPQGAPEETPSATTDNSDAADAAAAIAQAAKDAAAQAAEEEKEKQEAKPKKKIHIPGLPF